MLWPDFQAHLKGVAVGVEIVSQEAGRNPDAEWPVLARGVGVIVGDRGPVVA